ncbi:MAG: hypothetical protein AAB393_07650, partial [Bacteroidota bacterium]
LTTAISQQMTSYQFFYTPDNGVASSLVISNLSRDGQGQLFGMTFKLNVSNPPSMGNMNVKLKYYNTGVKHSNWQETDSDIDFPVQLIP